MRAVRSSTARRAAPGAAAVQRPRFWASARREPSVADFISAASPLSDTVTLLRSGDVLRVWRLAGVPFETAQPAEVSESHEALCALLHNLSAGRCTVHAHRVQRRITDRLADPPATGFARDFSLAYQDSLGSRPMLAKELFLSVVFRPHETMAEARAARRTRQALADDRAAAVRQMDEIAALVAGSLRAFEPLALGRRRENGADYWEPGEFLGLLVNGRWSPVRWPGGPAWVLLPGVRLSFGGSLLELRSVDARRYACMLDLKEYPSAVEPGTLGALLYEDCEFIESQSLALLPRRQALAALTLQRDQLLATDDVVTSQIEAMDQALDAVGDGRIAMGEYAYTLAVFGDSADEARRRAAAAIGAVARVSAAQLVPVDLVADAAWYSQQPGNARWRTRKASISSRAFAALACAHNFHQGKRDGNPWGEALAMLPTPAGHPFYLSFHVSPPDEDSVGDKLPGNTIVVGQTGSGKTTLLCALLALTRKWPTAPRLVSFSLDRDTEPLIRALGGSFHRFDRGTPTGLNPFQREPTPGRIGHWARLVAQCLHAPALPLLPSDLQAIDRAVRTLADLPAAARCMSTLRQSLPRQGENGLYDRLGRWCRGGELGWVFDEAPDGLPPLDSLRIAGFDYTGIVGDDDVKTAVMLELLHVMDSLIDGGPFVYHVAEVWRALGDPVFASFVRHQQKTIRKMNGLGVFDTQQVEDLLGNANGRAMVEQSVTKILLPNADATRDDYVDGLGLTEGEFECVKALGRHGDRRLLVKQGGRSVQCLFDVSACRPALDVLSASAESLQVLDEVRRQHGDEAQRWLPAFHARLAARRAERQASNGSAG